jgi:hypothetical protein
MAPFADSSKKDRPLIGVMYFDAETMKLAFDLVDAFRQAGWGNSEKGFWYHKKIGRPPSGLMLFTHSDGETPSGSVELRQALQEFGLPINSSSSDEVPEGEFRLLVGLRPNR